MGFISLYAAYSGLFASQLGIDTASHNAAHASTDDYSSQSIDLAARPPVGAVEGLERNSGTSGCGWMQNHGVSIDEEMAQLITDQRSYEAAARVMNAVDQTLDSLTMLGAAANRIQSTDVGDTDEMMSIPAQRDIELAKAVMGMQLQESAYQAALAAFSRATQWSLVDFLR